MKDGTKNIIAAFILAVGIVVSAIIYAYSNRYEVDDNYRTDKWTGTYIDMNDRKEKK